MQRSLLLLLQFFCFTVLLAQHRLLIKIDCLPANTKGQDLYIAGNFNNWNPGEEKFKFHQVGNGAYYADLKLLAGTYEYKITRGSWAAVESLADGKDKANRQLKVSGDQSFTINIQAWKDAFADTINKHTASKNVWVVDTAFYMPQLKRTRKISIYLPDDYTASGKRYPVLYLHDGQNMFDDATAFAGEWGIDEFMDTMQLQKCIVVAIDNGGDKRQHEYNPFNNKIFGKGEGALYVSFMVNTLKPFIDKKFRTHRDKKNTFIAGSSMGGLISLYAVTKYPSVFGGAGVFSPSIWICKNDIVKQIRSTGKKIKANIYFYCGKLESKDMVSDMLLVFQELITISKSKMTTVIRDDGKHNELSWRKEFPLFYAWMIK